MTTLSCPNCAAKVEVGPEDVVAVCPYCTTCFKLDGAVVKEHYLMPSYYSSSEAVDQLILWIKKQVGVAEDLPVHLEVGETALGYYPFWHVNVEAYTTYQGIGEDATYSWPIGFNTYRSIASTSKPESGSLKRQLSLTYPSSRYIPKELLGYDFPTRSKKYFSQAYSKQMGGLIYNSYLTQEAAEQMAKSQAQSILTQVIAEEVFRVDSREDRIDVTSVFYLHVPIWHARYRFKQKQYEAFIDACTGRIIHATYPVSLEHRAKYGSIAAAHLGIAAISILVLRLLAPTAAIALTVGACAIGTVFLIRGLQFGRGKERAE